MAGLLDFFENGSADTMGLLGLSPEDIQKRQKSAQADALFALAGSLFKGGKVAPSILQGLQQGSQAYQNTMQAGLQQQLQNAQLQEMLKKRQQEQQTLAEQKRVQNIVGQGVIPEQATFQGQPSQFPARDDQGNLMPDMEIKPAGFDLASIAPQLMSSPEGRKSLAELLTAQKAMGGETTTLAEGASLVRVNPLTGKVENVAQGAPKREPVPSAIVEYKFAQDQGYKGSFQDFELAKRAAGAQNTVVNVAGKTFASEFSKGAGEAVNNAFSAAQGAVGTLGRIETLKPILEGGKLFSGTLGSSQVAGARLADALNIGGKDNTERLQNTALAMQQLAGLELNAAEAMKGQGAITENERGLIARAAAGDLMKMTAKEVSTLLGGLEKTAKYKITIHESNMERLEKNPDLAAVAQYYKLPTTAPSPQSTGLPSGVTVKRK